MRKLLIGLLLLVLSGGIVFGYLFYQNKQEIAAIHTYQDCAAAGFPILESYPPQCMTPDKHLFTQDIGNTLAYRDEIIVDTPLPGEAYYPGGHIRGRARGSWFFEGSFTAEVYDAKGKLLGTGIMYAPGDWMTSDFVRFVGDVVFTQPDTDTGVIKFKNANPSGLPEKQKELHFPVIF